MPLKCSAEVYINSRFSCVDVVDTGCIYRLSMDHAELKSHTVDSYALTVMPNIT